MMREKRRLFEIYIRDRNERNREEYRQKNQEIRMMARQKKKEVDERDGIQASRKFRENKKPFWSEVNMKRKERDQMSMQVRDSDGNNVNDASGVKQR